VSNCPKEEIPPVVLELPRTFIRWSLGLQGKKLLSGGSIYPTGGKVPFPQRIPGTFTGKGTTGFWPPGFPPLGDTPGGQHKGGILKGSSKRTLCGTLATMGVTHGVFFKEAPAPKGGHTPRGDTAQGGHG